MTDSENTSTLTTQKPSIASSYSAFCVLIDFSGWKLECGGALVNSACGRLNSFQNVAYGTFPLTF